MRTVVALAALLIVTAGCGSTGSNPASKTVAGTNTLDQEVAEAHRRLGTTVDALAKVVEVRGTAMPANYDLFRAELKGLDGQVQSLRDRATAFPARRDEYMKHWMEQTAEIKNPEMRKTAEERRTQLMTDFMTLNGKGTELKNAYAPVHSSLHDCARFLESDLTDAGASALGPELGRLRELQKKVDAAVAEYRKGLQGIQEKLGSAPVKK